MPAIGQPVQGYYYDQTTDTLRPIAAQASTVDLPGRHRYTTTVPPDIVDGQLWLDSDAPYTPTSQVPTFTNVADRDAQWTSPPNGALCITLDTYTTWIRRGGVWENTWPKMVGYAQNTTGASGITTGDIPGLSCTFTAYAGHRYHATMFAYGGIQQTAGYWELKFYNAAGTTLAAAIISRATGNTSWPLNLSTVVTPGAGSYQIRCGGGGTASFDLYTGPTTPATLTVVDQGP